MDLRRDLGRWGEDAAANHLRKKGYKIVARNVRSRLGEIDIVASQGDCIVFVEVRTRKSVQMAPEESVTMAKQRRVAALGAEYLSARGTLDVEWRVDVIAIEQGRNGGLIRLEHYENALEVDW